MPPIVMIVWLGLTPHQFQAVETTAVTVMPETARHDAVRSEQVRQDGQRVRARADSYRVQGPSSMR
jgi:hypothetical protein